LKKKFCAVATRVSYVSASSAGRNYFLGEPSRGLSSAFGSRGGPQQRALQTFTASIILSSPDGATFGEKTEFLQLSAPPVQKLGGRWYPIPIPSNLLWWSLKPATKKFRAAVTSFEFTGERRRAKSHFAVF